MNESPGGGGGNVLRQGRRPVCTLGGAAPVSSGDQCGSGGGGGGGDGVATPTSGPTPPIQVNFVNCLLPTA